MKRFFTPYTIVLLVVMGSMAIRNNMMANPMDWVMSKVYILPGIIIGLSLHEFAHAFVASKLGDDTPRLQGRVTINPLSHIDPIGMIALLFVGFGWGVPVQINPYNFKKRRRDELFVSLAGVVMNLIVAIVFTLVLKLIIIGVSGGSDLFGLAQPLFTIVQYIVHINLVLMVFNLLPIPPLDGFNILTELFDLRKYSWWINLYNNGFLILVILIVFNFTGRILGPIINFFWGILSMIL